MIVSAEFGGKQSHEIGPWFLFHESVLILTQTQRPISSQFAHQHLHVVEIECVLSVLQCTCTCVILIVQEKKCMLSLNRNGGFLWSNLRKFVPRGRFIKYTHLFTYKNLVDMLLHALYNSMQEIKERVSLWLKLSLQFCSWNSQDHVVSQSFIQRLFSKPGWLVKFTNQLAVPQIVTILTLVTTNF